MLAEKERVSYTATADRCGGRSHTCEKDVVTGSSHQSKIKGLISSVESFGPMAWPTWHLWPLPGHLRIHAGEGLVIMWSSTKWVVPLGDVALATYFWYSVKFLLRNGMVLCFSLPLQSSFRSKMTPSTFIPVALSGAACKYLTHLVAQSGCSCTIMVCTDFFKIGMAVTESRNL